MTKYLNQINTKKGTKKYQNSYLFHKLCKNLQLVQRKNRNFQNTSQSSLKTQNHATLSTIFQ